MNLVNAIEGGLTGAGTLTLLQEALYKVNGKTSQPLMDEEDLVNKIKSHSGKSGVKANKLYINLAGQLLANTAYFGLAGLGKRKNAITRGGLLGAAAGLASVFLKEKLQRKKSKTNDGDKALQKSGQGNEMSKKILTVALYTAGGLMAGLVVKKMKGKNKKINKWIKKGKSKLRDKM